MLPDITGVQEAVNLHGRRSRREKDASPESCECCAIEAGEPAAGTTRAAISREASSPSDGSGFWKPASGFC